MLFSTCGYACQAAAPEGNKAAQVPNTSKCTGQKRRQVVLPEGSKVVYDINYAGTDDPFQELDLYLPPEAKSQPVPVIVWIHGGGYVTGGKRGKLGVGFVSRGFALAKIEYRLSTEASWPAQIHDCKAAVRWLRAHAAQYNLDPKHIGVWGASAGGQLALLMGTKGIRALEGNEGNKEYPSDVQVVVDWYGPTDFTHITEQVAIADPQHQSPVETVDLISKLLGGPISTHLDRAKQASPITYLTKNCPPTLIVHGDADHIIPVQQSREYYDAAKKLGADVTLHIVPNGGHGEPNFTPEIVVESMEFFNRLKDPSNSQQQHQREQESRAEKQAQSGHPQ
jgi:acetyl esterase/lipase